MHHECTISSVAAKVLRDQQQLLIELSAEFYDSMAETVVAAAVTVAGIGFPLVARRAKPILADKFVVPEKTDIDLQLITGSVLFGVGWGLAGLCPGPAIAALASMSPPILMFVAAMIGGQLLASRFE